MIHFKYHPTIYAWVSPPRSCMHLSSSPYVLHALSISFLIWWPKYLVSTDHKVSHYVNSPITSSIIGPNIFLSALFPNTLILCPSLIVWDQVSHPYKTEGKIIVLCIFTFIFLDSKLEDRRFCLTAICTFPHDSLGMFPNIWSVPPFQRIYYLYVCVCVCMYIYIGCDFALHAGLETWPYT